MKILITGGNGNIAKVIKKNLSTCYDVISLNRNELNILNYADIKIYLDNNDFDILIHTAILGGTRLKEENGEVTHNNLLMFENLVRFSYKFKMIINLDSGAVYDRSTDILNRKENDLYTVPRDYYGFSKYLIYQRSLQYNNIYNFRIFNLFHSNDEDTRFIKSCFNSNNNKTDVTIFEDKYFDFIYEDDFTKIMRFYIDNSESQEKLNKTINLCYQQKYKLSDIAKLVIEDLSKLKVLKPESNNNYCGNGDLLNNLNLNLLGLEDSLKLYREKLLNNT